MPSGRCSSTFRGRRRAGLDARPDVPVADRARGTRIHRVRELHQLRRPLAEAIDVPPTPDGIDIRAFAVGTDEDAWVAVNAAAFAQHPEQGRWTRADLEAREHDAWFDPAGFLLAWRGDDLLGFHWTKIHPDGAGEVYVIGVSPHGAGLRSRCRAVAARARLTCASEGVPRCCSTSTATTPPRCGSTSATDSVVTTSTCSGRRRSSRRPRPGSCRRHSRSRAPFADGSHRASGRASCATAACAPRPCRGHR